MINKETLNSSLNNIGFIFLLTICLTIFTMSAPDLATAGLGGLANLFFPSVIGGITLLIYLISRLLSRKWNWIITIFGMTYNLYISIQIFFDLL